MATGASATATPPPSEAIADPAAIQQGVSEEPLGRSGHERLLLLTDVEGAAARIQKGHHPGGEEVDERVRVDLASDLIADFSDRLDLPVAPLAT